MIVQNANITQGAPPAKHGSSDVLKVIADTPKAVANTTTQIAAQKPSPEQLKNAVASLNKAMLQSNHSLEFSVDPNTKTPVVKMTDSVTGELISQFPSEAVLAIASSIDQFLSQHQSPSGLLLKQKA